MKEKLLGLLSRVIELLVDCGWKKEADWFSQIQNEIEHVPLDSAAMSECLSKLDSVLAGIGSFSDLPLKSQSGRLTQQEIRDLQWSLVEELGSTIKDLLR
jgi:hypothetical protein